jgi:hypothetical protein
MIKGKYTSGRNVAQKKVCFEHLLGPLQTVKGLSIIFPVAKKFLGR